MDSSGFYDSFVAYQVTSGINDRIFGLYKRVLRSRISSRSNILEIGCGIGSLTFLLGKKIRSGKIEAVDISPKSVAFARNRIPDRKISFTASDIVDFTPSARVFDRILLFDVLEHMPEAQLPLLFQKVRSWMKDDSLLLINLPNPAYILFDRANDPAALQETDNPVFLHTLSGMLDDASLEIVSFETYGVWVRDDYQFYTVKIRQEFVKTDRQNQRSLLQKARARFIRRFRRIVFRYP